MQWLRDHINYDYGLVPHAITNNSINNIFQSFCKWLSNPVLISFGIWHETFSFCINGIINCIPITKQCLHVYENALAQSKSYLLSNKYAVSRNRSEISDRGGGSFPEVFKGWGGWFFTTYFQQNLQAPPPNPYWEFLTVP